VNIGLCALGAVMYFVGCIFLGVITERSTICMWLMLGFVFFGGMIIGVGLP